MSICGRCLHRLVCGKYKATGGVKDCRDYIFEEKIWCNNCYGIYKKVNVPYKGIVQYCPGCGLMIGTMVGRMKRCNCGAIIPEEFDCCPNCDTPMDTRAENADPCVCCGAIIPEGLQYCPSCGEIKGGNKNG